MPSPNTPSSSNQASSTKTRAVLPSEKFPDIIYNTLSNILNRETVIYLIILGLKAEQNLYTAKLMAILMAIKGLPLDL